MSAGVLHKSDGVIAVGWAGQTKRCLTSCVVVFVCHSQVRRHVSQGSRCRGSLMHELISLDSAIDPLVTSQSGVCCK